MCSIIVQSAEELDIAPKPWYHSVIVGAPSFPNRLDCPVCPSEHHLFVY